MHKGVIIESETSFRVVDFEGGDMSPVIDGTRYAARQCAGRFDGVIRRGFVLFNMEQDPAIEWSSLALRRAKALAMVDADEPVVTRIVRPLEIEDDSPVAGL